MARCVYTREQRVYILKTKTNQFNI